MKYNTLVSYIVNTPHFYHENVHCPHCETNQGEVYENNTRCESCGYYFMISEESDTVQYLNPLQSLGIHNCDKLFSEDISKVTQGKTGWKNVVATYHDPNKSETFDIFWSMVGSNTLFKNGDKVDLQAAAKYSTHSDKSNKTQYHYNPEMEQMNTTIEIKSIINKYNLDSAGYSVCSFVISSDGNKIFSGAPIETFDSADARPFYSSLEQCKALKASMSGRYAPNTDVAQDTLQIAINNFIADDPIIFSLPTDNRTPDEVGRLSNFTGESMDDMHMEQVLAETWSNHRTVTPDGLSLVGSDEFNPRDGNFSKNMYNDNTFYYTINNKEVKVFTSEHTDYRLTHQRDIRSAEVDMNSTIHTNMYDIDNYVGAFVTFIYNIFDVNSFEADDKISFLYSSQKYGRGKSLTFEIYTDSNSNPTIVLGTLLPLNKTEGNFDYKVKNDVIVGGDKVKLQNKNTQSNKAKNKANAKNNLDLIAQEAGINKKNIKAPKNMKGAKAAEWRKREYKRQIDNYLKTG